MVSFIPEVLRSLMGLPSSLCLSDIAYVCIKYTVQEFPLHSIFLEALVVGSS